MKIISTVNGKTLEQLTKEEKKQFNERVIERIESLGYKVHMTAKNKIK